MSKIDENTFRISTAGLGDVARLAQVHADALAAGYAGFTDEAWMSRHSAAALAEDWTRWVREPGVRVLMASRRSAIGLHGLAAYGPIRSPLRSQGRLPVYSTELYGLFVAPNSWGTGTASALMTAVAEAMPPARGGLVALVLKPNLRALAFYKRLKGVPVETHKIQHGRRKVDEIVIGWRDTAALADAAAADIARALAKS